MFNSELLNLRRWGALTCVIALSLVLAACGDDTETNNGTATNNGGVADSGTDGGTDAGFEDVGLDGSGPYDGGQDAGGDTNPGADAGDTSSTDEDASAEAIEIAGVYDNGFGGTETITSDDWTTAHPDYGTTVYAVISFDNTDNFTVTQNSDDGTANANKFNKVVWTEPAADGSFYNCTVTYGEDTADAAANTDATADDTDLDGEGCGGFAWTKLTPQ